MVAYVICVDVQGVCSESASFDLPAAVLAASVQEVQTALEVALVRREDSGPVHSRELSIVGAGLFPQLCQPMCSHVLINHHIDTKYISVLLNVPLQLQMDPIRSTTLRWQTTCRH